MRERQNSIVLRQASFHLCDYRMVLKEAVAEENAQRLSAVFEEIGCFYLPDELSLEEVLPICFSLLHFISSSISNSQLLFLQYDPMEELRTIVNASQAKEWLNDLKARIVRHWQTGTGGSNPTVERIIQYIYANPCEELSLQSIAVFFRLSPQYISNIFSKDSPVSFSEHVRLSKMRYAKRKLSENEISIREIAQMLGYSDPYYFSKVFKKTEGMSPKKFQATIR